VDRVRNFAAGILRVDKSAFDLVTGFRAACFAIVPVIVGFAVGQPELAIVGLGAIFLTNTEGRRPSALPIWVLLVACFAESAALGLGRLASTTTGLLPPLLLGTGLFLLLTARGNSRWGQVGTFAAIIFAVGIGLPHGSAQVAEQESAFALIGGLWALVGAGMQRLFSSQKETLKAKSAPSQPGAVPIERHGPVVTAFAIAVAGTLGFVIGLALNLPRDFWIVVTVITAVRPNLGLMVAFTLTVVIGTVVGALIAAAITLGTSSPYLLSVLLFAFSVLMFSSRGVNTVLFQTFLVPFIIILLNIVYPGQWYFAFDRILDVAIGGAIAIGVVYVFDAVKNLGRDGK
jgi:hypothetical protein